MNHSETQCNIVVTAWSGHKLHNLLLCITYLCLKGETNWQYWQLYLSSLLNSAMAEWLLSWDLSPCMDMKTRSHWPHGWPPAANRCLRWSCDIAALAAATRVAARPSTATLSGSSVSSMASPSESMETSGEPKVFSGSSAPSTRSPLVRISEGNVRGTSLTSCCKTRRRSNLKTEYMCQYINHCAPNQCAQEARLPVEKIVNPQLSPEWR